MANPSYTIVDPGLAQPRHALSDHAQARIVAYLLRHLAEIAPIPKAVKAALIPVQYLGRPFPALGLYQEANVDSRTKLSDAALAQLSFTLGERLEDYIQATGITRLAALSSSEQPHWEDIAAPLREPAPSLG